MRDMAEFYADRGHPDKADSLLAEIRQIEIRQEETKAAESGQDDEP